MSHAANIAQQAEAMLLAVPELGGRVTRSLEKGYSYQDFPVALLHLVADVPAAQPAPMTVEYRQLTLELELLAEGDVPHDAVEAVLPAAHAAIMALPFCVSTGSQQWSYDDENPALGIVRVQYHITYRRLEGEL